MTRSVLAAVRDAVAGADDHSLDEEGQPGASAPSKQESGMSKDAKPAGSEPAGEDTRVSRADHDAAVAAAETRGRDAGANGERARIGAALGAEGIKGHSKRMSAALDLAVSSPAMEAAAVSAFVLANVGAAEASYETQRVADAGLAQPAAAKSESAVDRIVGNHRLATGKAPKSA